MPLKQIFLRIGEPKNINLLDFLGFILNAFLRLLYIYFYGYKIRVFTKEIVTKNVTSYVRNIRFLRIINLK